jgi:A/G-specific adenine glycosylase
MQRQVETHGFSKELIGWYLVNHRELPWRSTRDAYRIWLSEIILQQTRVEQGMPYYEAFVEAFPTIHDLAAAPEDRVLRLWQGLGYYNRARNMLAASRYISEELDGHFPTTAIELEKLKGIGTYTAAAIASFAFGEAVPVLDGNVIRVLSRYLGFQGDVSKSASLKELRKWAAELLDLAQPDTHNQAMMELGALICKPKNPACSLCPVRWGCEAARLGTQEAFPVKSKKTTITSRYLNYLLFEGPRGQIYVQKRDTNGIWRGLYEFFLWETPGPVESDQALIKEIMTHHPQIKIRQWKAWPESLKHQLSHQLLHLNFIQVEIYPSFPAKSLSETGIWVKQKDFEEFPKPIILQKFLTNLNT